jgi:hypothetical protein
MNISDLEIQPVSYTYVVIWKDALSVIPPINPEFCKNLYNSPNETQFGFNANGLFVTSRPHKTISQTAEAVTIELAPNINLGYTRFSIMDRSKESFLSVYTKLVDELKLNHSGFYANLKSAQVGINMEFELILKNGISSNVYLKDKFNIQPASTTIADIQFQQISFQIVENAKEKKMAIILQIRETDGTILCITNDHYGISPSESIFTPSQLDSYIQKSFERIKEHVLPILD